MTLSMFTGNGAEDDKPALKTIITDAMTDVSCMNFIRACEFFMLGLSVWLPEGIPRFAFLFRTIEVLFSGSRLTDERKVFFVREMLLAGIAGHNDPRDGFFLGNMIGIA
jgi:hypothetical protein